MRLMLSNVKSLHFCEKPAKLIDAERSSKGTQKTCGAEAPSDPERRQKRRMGTEKSFPRETQRADLPPDMGRRAFLYPIMTERT